MSNADLPPDHGYEPIYDGMPMLVRLITGEELLSVAYHSKQDDRILLERPILILMENSETLPDHATKLSLTRVRTRFERWLYLSDAFLFPVYTEHVLTLAPLAEPFIEAYIEWSEKLYETGVTLRETQPTKSVTNTTPDLTSSTPVSLPANTTVQEIRESYFDYVLHNFRPKGKPN